MQHHNSHNIKNYFYFYLGFISSHCNAQVILIIEYDKIQNQNFYTIAYVNL